MDQIVKASIDARKNAMINAYEIKDKSIIDKIEELFKKINELGGSCTNSSDFETRFATSDLNQEYINLFTDIASSCSPINHIDDNSNVKSDKEYILEDIDSEIRYQVEDATQPMRRQATQEAYDKARDIPVLGDMMNIQNKFDLFNKFKKDKDE